jgi:regulator of protease activity HflC (stomatin/prohibitin superfamily)
MIAAIVGVVVLILLSSLVMSWVYQPTIDPPVAVVLRRFGKIAWVKVLRRWIVVLPVIEEIETFSVDLHILTVTPDEVIAPDNVGLEISVTLYLKADENNLEAYWKSGKMDGVSKILSGITEQEIRQWARDPNNPPRTWEEAQSSQNDLVKKLHDDLVREGGGDPTDANNPHALKNYGVLLEKATIGAIKPKGPIAEAKDLAAKEELERVAELKEIKTKVEIAKIAAEELKISRKEAFKLTQDYEILRAAKAGGVYKVTLGDLPKVLSFLSGKLGGTGGD